MILGPVFGWVIALAIFGLLLVVAAMIVIGVALWVVFSRYQRYVEEDRHD